MNGDYKFPGGGIEKTSKVEALRREVLEEVGGIVTKVEPQYALITTYNKESLINEFDVFHMDSHYFFVRLKKTNETSFKSI